MEVVSTFATVAAAIVALVVLAVVGAVYAKVRFKIATPDEALIITGRKSGTPVINPETGEETTDLSGQRVVIGGGTFVKPIFEQVVRLSLASQSFSVAAEDATTKSGVGVTLRSIAVVKVGGTERMVRAAAQRFAGRSQEQVIEQQTSEVLVGVLRTIAGTLTVESILYERQDFSKEVKDIAVPMLAERGLVLENFEIQTVEDSGDYIRNLGRPRAAAVARDAEIAEAQARQESTQRSNEAAVQIAESNKAVALRNAQIARETATAQAEAEAAKERAEAEAQQSVLEQQELVAQGRAALREQELQTEVRKPAEARKYEQAQEAEARRYAAEQEAEAASTSAIRAAEAEAQRTTAQADAEASAARSRAEAALVEQQRRAEGALAIARAEADGTRARGEAEAAAEQAKGEARAAAIKAEADAYQTFPESARLQMVLDALPKVAQPYADALASIDGITVIDKGGASNVTGHVATGVQELAVLLKAQTGIDLMELVRGRGDGWRADGRDGTTRPAPAAVAAGDAGSEGADASRA
ncbi:SPFH domain-containing protein [Cellulomonas shaoxiangyii]|uniref:Flotillin family protein n=1 Tax=Cellulomonas shaoxiangyii TaxID=2566013 RepID=A0A4P7SNU2_9CELL|nr:flotillin family protein [Cellulomonas shaoxiangyii]QCB94303.1 flotillin family protein [Cellulomonas shaoxiangyii]TGY84526.1 flotillin family protein [Cellulomonas shaoxiangyii]